MSSHAKCLPPAAMPPPIVADRKTLARAWHRLDEYTLEYTDAGGCAHRVTREVCRRGDRAVALLTNCERGTILLVRQFRLAAYLNGHADGMVIECPSGLLDGDDPRTAIHREVREETGCETGELHELLIGYMSPGTLGERMHFFTGDYSPPRLAAAGDPRDGPIEVLEIPPSEAWSMIDARQIVDAKTVLLLYHARAVAGSA
jgi:nudix-type nucleoside diphosphatase (YffH/AdpP family)